MDWSTHSVSNQVDELRDVDLLAIDPALQQHLHRLGAAWALPGLHAYGTALGRSTTFEQAAQANAAGPVLQRFDARGRRIDEVRFHPDWHALLTLLRGQGWMARPFADRRPGRWAAAAAGMLLHGQVEAGTLCPATMTQAAIPVLRRDPALWAWLGERLLDARHDPSDQPIDAKPSIWLGMGMTEKQGGSDVRANTTTATPIGSPDSAEALLRGHKWFYSAPSSDAHLVVARTAEGGLSCYLVPRWRPDGQRNAVRIQRLKDKLGNRSNASGEVEFEDAWGLRVGEPGRGIPTILEMATHTRLNCVLGSTALMRAGVVQALAYARRRQAFGRPLAQQPLMRSVLTDLALESEAALVLALHLAQAFEDAEGPAPDPLARAWQRLMTPAAKLWVCKRAVAQAGEALEVLGGNGYVEESSLARLYREAPVNSVWEGSGNVMALDLLRALGREREAAQRLWDDLAEGCGDEPRLRAALHALAPVWQGPTDAAEGQARQITQRLVLLAQAVLLRRHAPAAVAEGFIATRFGPDMAGIFGALDPAALDVEALLDRALPTAVDEGA